MKREQLIALGMTEEQVTNILKIYKETIDGAYVPKHRFDEVAGELKTVKETLGERDTQIESLKKFEGDQTALKEQIKTLQNENATKATEFQKTLVAEQKRNAVRLSLLNDGEGKPHDPDMVLGLFDLEAIKVDETTGKITNGLKEQLESIRKEKSFLFTPKETVPAAGAGFKPAGFQPIDGAGNPAVGDPSVSYGKTLAQAKLGMMGVQPTTPTPIK